MLTGSIWLITNQKVLKTRSVKSMEQHYLSSNHVELTSLVNMNNEVKQKCEK